MEELKMIKTINNLDDLSKVVKQDPKKYYLGELVREMVALNFMNLAYSSGNSSSQEGKQQLLATIENRTNALYAELDRRERIYRGACELPTDRGVGRIEGGKHW